MTSDGPDGTPAEGSPATIGHFDGTPDEYVSAMISCLGDQGVQAIKGSGVGSFGIGSVVRSDAEVVAVTERCRAEVGDAYVGLTDEQLRPMYEWRVTQFACFARNGYVHGEPPSFETFLSDYQRYGALHWVPLSDADLAQAAESSCPKPTDQW